MAQAYGVLGFGKTGASAARVLARCGQQVVVWDDCPEARAAAVAAGFEVRKLTGPLAGLVASPGISPAHPELQAAERSGVRAESDIDLFWRRLQRSTPGSSRVIGVTGTNGKSSVVAWITHLLRAAGRSCAAGGNFGTPVLDLPCPLDGIYVLELSSFQLARSVELRPDVAVILNVGSDHLDWHGSRQAYVTAKERIVRGQGPEDVAVVCIDDAEGQRICTQLQETAGAPRVAAVSASRRCAGGVGVVDGVLHDDLDGQSRDIGRLDSLVRTSGRHTWQNAVASWAAARLAGAGPDELVPALGTFRGLPHRLEPVASVDGVQFINDSKATNVAAAAAALACFDNACWLAGGRGKGEDLSPLVELLDRVDSGFFFGEHGPALKAAFGGRIPVRLFDTMEPAVASAFDRARASTPPLPVVLSPACASYDQYRNFEARGAAFRTIVGALSKAAS